MIIALLIVFGLLTLKPIIGLAAQGLIVGGTYYFANIKRIWLAGSILFLCALILDLQGTTDLPAYTLTAICVVFFWDIMLRRTAWFTTIQGKFTAYIILSMVWRVVYIMWLKIAGSLGLALPAATVSWIAYFSMLGIGLAWWLFELLQWRRGDRFYLPKHAPTT